MPTGLFASLPSRVHAPRMRVRWALIAWIAMASVLVHAQPSAEPPVLARVHEHMGAIRSCFEHALRRDPSTTAVCEIRFTVSASGRAGDVQLEPAPVPPALAVCIARVIEAIDFPTLASGPMQVDVPLCSDASE